MLVPVILAGGLGTRLWPVSRPEYPKPLIRLTGDRSLLQETLLRAAAIPDATPPIIVCGAVHYPPIVRQLDEIEQQALPALLEPVGRGTAPAAAVAAMAVEEDDILFVMPADHLVDDMEAFINAIRSAADAARAGWLVTFGVTPDRPETGYGYIERGGAIDDLAGAYRIASFREKPDLATARRYVDGGRHLWNSGMFLFRAGTYLDELRQSNPEIVRLTKESLAAGAGHGGSLRNRGGTLLDPVVFSACPTGSIDRTVMEVTRRGVSGPSGGGLERSGIVVGTVGVGDQGRSRERGHGTRTLARRIVQLRSGRRTSRRRDRSGERGRSRHRARRAGGRHGPRPTGRTSAGRTPDRFRSAERSLTPALRRGFATELRGFGSRGTLAR